MSLSNIRNNPRQEIKETLIGFAVVAGIAIGTFLLGIKLIYPMFNQQDTPTYILSMFLGFVATVIIVALPFVVHSLGEAVVDDWDL